MGSCFNQNGFKQLPSQSLNTIKVSFCAVFLCMVQVQQGQLVPVD